MAERVDDGWLCSVTADSATHCLDVMPTADGAGAVLDLERMMLADYHGWEQTAEPLDVAA